MLVLYCPFLLHRVHGRVYVFLQLAYGHVIVVDGERQTAVGEGGRCMKIGIRRRLTEITVLPGSAPARLTGRHIRRSGKLARNFWVRHCCAHVYIVIIYDSV